MKKPNRPKIPEFVLLLPLVLILGASCPSEKRELRELLARYQAGVNRQDPQEFLACFDPAYRDRFFAPEAARQSIAQALSGPHRPALKLSEQKFELASAGAKVSQSYRLEWFDRDRPRQSEGSETLELKREGQAGWRIVGGSELYQVLAGREAELEAIRLLLTRRMEALRSKDLEAFKQLVDPEYDFHGKDYGRVIADLEGNFRDYERIELKLDRPRISLADGRAVVVEGYELRGRYQGGDREFHDTEKLELRKTAAGWKISKGL